MPKVTVSCIPSRAAWVDPTVDAAIAEDEPDPEPGDDATTVYYIFTADHELLYVGVTLSALALQRMSQHAKGKEWWNEAAYVSLEHMPDRESAEARERAAIRRLKPRHNIAHAVRRGGGVNGCEIDTCHRKHKARGLCEAHYRQALRSAG